MLLVLIVSILDWLFERINRDPAVVMKFVGTKEQSSDILTKGSFTADAWLVLCNLCLVMPIVSFDPTAELKELKNLRACISVALCSNTFVNMYSKPATNNAFALEAGAPARQQQKNFSAQPSWSTKERQAKGRSVSPEQGPRGKEAPWAGDFHDAAWKAAGLKFCQDVYTLCRAGGDLHDFNTRVASGSFNWIIEVNKWQKLILKNAC